MLWVLCPVQSVSLFWIDCTNRSTCNCVKDHNCHEGLWVGLPQHKSFLGSVNTSHTLYNQFDIPKLQAPCKSNIGQRALWVMAAHNTTPMWLCNLTWLPSRKIGQRALWEMAANNNTTPLWDFVTWLSYQVAHISPNPRSINISLRDCGKEARYSACLTYLSCPVKELIKTHTEDSLQRFSSWLHYRQNIHQPHGLLIHLSKELYFPPQNDMPTIYEIKHSCHQCLNCTHTPFMCKKTP